MIKRQIIAIGLALAIIYLMLAVATLPSTGLVWDETRYIAAAKAKAYFFYAAITGKPQLDMCSLTVVPTGDDTGRCWDGRPRLAQTISGPFWAVVWFLSGQNLDVMSSVAVHRIPIILLTAVGIFVIFLFASEAFSKKVGLFSTLAIIFIPRFFAHSHYVTLDVTAAVMIIITTYFFWKGLRSWKFGLLTGVMFGLALASKIYAYALLFIIPLWILIGYRDRLRSIFKNLMKGNIDKRYLVVILSFLFISPIVLYLAWPWVWHDTANRFMDYVGVYTNQNETLHVGSLYMGTIHDNPPWHYPWVMVILTLPLPILIFAIIGFLVGIRDTVSLRNRTSFLIILGSIIPIAIFSTPLAIPHNAVRLFLPAFPFIAILAGIGAEKVFLYFKKHLPKRSILILLLITLLIIVPGLVALLQGGVYSSTYYNELIGGQKGAFDNGLSVEYYGEAYLDMIYWINQNIPQNSVLYIEWAQNIFNTYKYGDIGQIFEIAKEEREGLTLNESVLGQFRGLEQKGLLREDLTISDKEEGSDYFISHSVFNYKTSPGSEYFENCEPLHVVDVNGAPVSVIYKTNCFVE